MRNLVATMATAPAVAMKAGAAAAWECQPCEPGAADMGPAAVKKRRLGAPQDSSTVNATIDATAGGYRHLFTCKCIRCCSDVAGGGAVFGKHHATACVSADRRLVTMGPWVDGGRMWSSAVGSQVMMEGLHWAEFELEQLEGHGAVLLGVTRSDFDPAVPGGGWPTETAKGLGLRAGGVCVWRGTQNRCTALELLVVLTRPPVPQAAASCGSTGSTTTGMAGRERWRAIGLGCCWTVSVGSSRYTKEANCSDRSAPRSALGSSAGWCRCVFEPGDAPEASVAIPAAATC